REPATGGAAGHRLRCAEPTNVDPRSQRRGDCRPGSPLPGVATVGQSEEGTSFVRRRFVVLFGLAALCSLLFSGAASPVRAQDNILTQAAKGTLKPARIHTAGGDRVLPFISAGTLIAATDSGNTSGAAPGA